MTVNEMTIDFEEVCAGPASDVGACSFFLEAMPFKEDTGPEHRPNVEGDRSARQWLPDYTNLEFPREGASTSALGYIFARLEDDILSTYRSTSAEEALVLPPMPRRSVIVKAQVTVSRGQLSLVVPDSLLD